MLPIGSSTSGIQSSSSSATGGLCPRDEVPLTRVTGAPDDLLARLAAEPGQAGLVPRYGRKILEVLPPVGSHKGTAVRRLLEEHELRRALAAGDDTTDLDSFAALDGLDVAVRVAVTSPEAPGALLDAADLVVADTAAVLALLRRL